MRKVLYSPGYGAGWSTWNGFNKEQKRWLCEYQPFIDYIEKHGELPRVSKDTWGDEYDVTDLGMQVIRDWKAAFPDSPIPYLGGMKNLTIRYLHDNEQYRIEEYDGRETVITRDMYEDEWL
jgi:hypothetical protein